LQDAVWHIKASFRNLDNSGSHLDQAVAKSRSRLLAQMLVFRDHQARDEDHVAKAPLPTMPWSKPRLDRRPVARLYAAAAAAAAAKSPGHEGQHSARARAEEIRERRSAHLAKGRLDGGSSDSGSDSGSVSEEGTEDEADPEDWALLTGKDVSMPTQAAEYTSDRLDEAVFDEEKDVDASSSPSGQRRGHGTIAGGRPSIRLLSGSTLDKTNLADFRGDRVPSPRLQLMVQTSRPFSASRVRPATARQVPRSQPTEAQRPSTARPASRPSTGNGERRDPPKRPSTATASSRKTPAGRPVSATGTRAIPHRPQSAFTGCRRPRPQSAYARERPPTAQLCEPQARCMSGAATAVKA